MKNIPFEVAKQFCEDYEKDQCIILSWDKKSGETWVTTYGKGDENSIQATNAGKLLKDHLKLKREKDCSDFDKAVEPAIRYLLKNYHPHTKIYIDYSNAELLEGQRTHNLNEEVSD